MIEPMVGRGYGRVLSASCGTLGSHVLWGSSCCAISPVGLPRKKVSKHELSLVVEGNKSKYRGADVGFLSHLVGEVTCGVLYLKQLLHGTDTCSN